MKTYNVILFFPNQPPHPAYTHEKWKIRHDEFISYFPKNVQFYLVKDDTKFLWDNTFEPNFVRHGNKWETYIWEKIYWDLILWPNKNQSFTNIYHNPIKEICRDKRKIEHIFPQYTLASYTCENYADIQKYWDKISSEVKVLKPIFWSQWTGIIISDALPEENRVTETYPYILQEFLDTNPGFYWHEWIHDFRTIILNGEITGSLLRIAPDWIMTANVNTWARIIDYWVWNIPPKVKQIIDEIDSYFAPLYPERYYSIDIGVGANWAIKVFELNSSPMLSTSSIIEWLAQHIIKNILKIG